MSPPIRDRSRHSSAPISFESHEDRKKAFMQLLQDHGISSTDTWERALKLIKHHEHFNALDTASERKQVFNEYKTVKSKKEKEQEKIKQKENDQKLVTFLKT